MSLVHQDLARERRRSAERECAERRRAREVQAGRRHRATALRRAASAAGGLARTAARQPAA